MPSFQASLRYSFFSCGILTKALYASVCLCELERQRIWFGVKNEEVKEEKMVSHRLASNRVSAQLGGTRLPR